MVIWVENIDIHGYWILVDIVAGDRGCSGEMGI